MSLSRKTRNFNTAKLKPFTVVIFLNEVDLVLLLNTSFLSTLAAIIYVTAQMCRRIEEEVAPTVGLPTP